MRPLGPIETLADGGVFLRVGVNPFPWRKIPGEHERKELVVLAGVTVGLGVELLLATEGALRVEAGLGDVTENARFLGREAALDHGSENGADRAVDVGRGGERAGRGEKFVGQDVIGLGGGWGRQVVFASIRARLSGVAVGNTIAREVGAARASRGGRGRRLGVPPGVSAVRSRSESKQGRWEMKRTVRTETNWESRARAITRGEAHRHPENTI